MRCSSLRELHLIEDHKDITEMDFVEKAGKRAEIWLVGGYNHGLFAENADDPKNQR